MAYQTVNPYDNQIVATFDDFTDEQVMELLGQAQKTFESWSQTSFAERTAVIKGSAAILRERSDEFARLLTLEMGKLYTEALGEVELSAQILDYYAEKSEGFLAPEPLETASADDTAMLVSAPLGVILGVQPWNFPYYQLARVAGAEPDGRQCGHGQARFQRAASGGRLREAAAGGGCTGRRVHEPVRHQGSDQPADRRRSRPRCGVDRQRGRRRGRGRPGGQEPQEIHHGTGRLGRIHRAGRL